MQLVLLLTVVAATASMSIWKRSTDQDASDFLFGKNCFPGEVLSYIPPHIQLFIKDFYAVVFDENKTNEEKMAEVGQMVKYAPEDEKEDSIDSAKKFLEINDWFDKRLEDVSSEVVTAVDQIMNKMMDFDFLTQSTEEKKKQIDEIVAGLSEEDMKTLKQIETEYDAELAKRGLDVESMQQKKSQKHEN